jgi:DNA-directed RNA polymerase specialized sigma24 family protein
VIDEVAIVASAKRDLLLRAHGYRLRREDLEDCYGQATLELLARARDGASFAGRLHIARAIELRFISRIHDRRRALSGRSPSQALIEQAAPLGSLEGEGGVEPIDRAGAVEARVLLREELRAIERCSRELTHDQRLALAAQLDGADGRALCTRLGWSDEKYRKVGQRARARLRALLDAEQI